jgi:tRNA pseudouridine55 synthase
MAAACNGILNIDKPRGWTSHDVVARVRRLLSVRLATPLPDTTSGQDQRGSPRDNRGTGRVGHAGTLDPLATGVLLVCVGQATRLAEYLTAGEKTYRATLQLGIETDTYDIDGEVVASASVPPLERQDLEQALAVFTGEILQTPPPYSAVKREGVPAYRRARRGEVVQLAPRRVVIHSVELLEWHAPQASIEVICDPGTYIRSLTNDLGQALGCGAVLTDLIRLRSGSFTLETAVTLDELAVAVEAGRLTQHLLPPAAALGALTQVPIDSDSSERLVNGQPIAAPVAATGPLGYAVEPDGSVRAILVHDPEAGLWRPKKVFAPGQ